jgi:hypothetical protein
VKNKKTPIVSNFRVYDKFERNIKLFIILFNWYVMIVVRGIINKKDF